MWHREALSWMEDTKRINHYQIKQVLDILNEAYWLLEDDEEALKDAERPLKLDHKEAKEKIYEAMNQMESEWQDLAMSKLDYVASDIQWQVEKIGSLKMDVSLTPSNGMW